MRRPPRPPDRPILTFALFMRSGLVCLIMLGGAYWLFFGVLRRGGSLAEARTTVINVIVMVEAAYLFNCRSLVHSLWSIGLWTNRWAIGGALGMLAAQLVFTYVPLSNRLFDSAPIGGTEWLRIAAVAVTALLAVEFEKWVRFGRGRGEHVVPE